MGLHHPNMHSRHIELPPKAIIAQVLLLQSMMASTAIGLRDKDKRRDRNRGKPHHSGTIVLARCAGCSRSSMAMEELVAAKEALEVLEVLEVLALEQVHHHCTMELVHWHRMFRCTPRNLQQTGGTSQCCRRHNHRNRLRICSSHQMWAELDPEAMVVLDHRWK